MSLDETRFSVTLHGVTIMPHGQCLTAVGALELDGPLRDARVRGSARSANLIGLRDRLARRPRDA